MKQETVEQLKEMLKEVRTEEEIAQITHIIEEAKGKFRPEEGGRDFWAGKTPCWEMFRCPQEVRAECPAHADHSHPCWEVEGTYCKLSDYGTVGDSTQICEVCRVYKKWGHGEPIEITVRGKGFNPVARALERAREMVEAGAEPRVEALMLGDTVRIKGCAERPELDGAEGLIVQMQTQHDEKYATRPVWVKMTSAHAAGKTIGFWQSEVEVVATAPRGRVAEHRPTRGLMRTVREKAKGVPEVVPALKLGDTVRIRGCLERPELDGAEGMVVQMQTQERETYATRPVWVRMTSGEGAGRVCGFLETELEV